jgi:adenosine/AMP kinase
MDAGWFIYTMKDLREVILNPFLPTWKMCISMSLANTAEKIAYTKHRR